MSFSNMLYSSLKLLSMFNLPLSPLMCSG